MSTTLVDAAGENIPGAQGRLRTLPPWLKIEYVTADVYAVAAIPIITLRPAHRSRRAGSVRRSLVLAHLRRFLKPGGSFYFTINFDGATILQPEIEPALELS